MTTHTEKTLDLKAVEDALEALVLAYREESRKPKSGKSDVPLFRHASDLPSMSREEAYRERIVREPIAGALRLGIREIGIHVWKKTGSFDQMQTVLRNVISRHPDKESSLGDMIDKAWDGIGGSKGWIA
ncbi:MAG: hypothetical protein WBX25_10705 [Rhodomicrobium sp.]